MPHIHNQPGECDFTVSAYIVRHESGGWKCLVHQHKKIGKLLQIGGHVETTETPWQAIAHELREESGYSLDDLDVLQPSKLPEGNVNCIFHPVPLFFNTHNFSSTHYHIDLAYGFVARDLPSQAPQDGESQELIWASVDELRAFMDNGQTLPDVIVMYEAIVNIYVQQYPHIKASVYSLELPK